MAADPTGQCFSALPQQSVRRRSKQQELSGAVPRPAAAVDLSSQRGEQTGHQLHFRDNDKPPDLLIQINVRFLQDLPVSCAFHTMRRALPPKSEAGYGRVINIASVHGLEASVNKAPYVASKVGLIGLYRVAALEYAASGDRKAGVVTVNCIYLGWTETAIIEPQVPALAIEFDGDRDAGLADLLAEKQPSRRLSDPSEIGVLAL